MRTTAIWCVAAMGLVAAMSYVYAAPDATTQPSADDVKFFQEKVRPILVERCYRCHSAEKHRGKLVLENLAGVLKGGEHGPAVVPGKPDDSLLIKAVSWANPKLKMPPRGGQLSDEQIAALTQWVKSGAPWSDAATQP